MPLNCLDLHEALRNQIEKAFRCKQVKTNLRITLPFLHADGDYVTVHAFGDTHLIRLTDFGTSMSRLRQMGLEPRKSRLELLLGRLNVELSGEALTTTTTRDHLLSAFLMIGQAISSLAAISFSVNVAVEPFVEIDQYISHHKIAAKRQYRLAVNVPTKHGTVTQHPQVDLFLKDHLIMMTVPGNKARLRKVNSTFKTLTVLDRAMVDYPRLTVYDSRHPIDREDAVLLQDLSAVIPSEFLKSKDPSYAALERIAAQRQSILPKTLF